MTIGYTNPGYPVIRTILDKCPECAYVRSRSYLSMFEKIVSNFHCHPCFGAAFCGGTNLNRIDLMHFFNVIDMSIYKKKYITTFETMLPRFPNLDGWWWKRGLDSLASSSCRRLIALSECNAAMQRRLFASLGMDEVIKKIMVIHPPQKLLVDSVDSKIEKSVIRFIFIGKDFFRKGGGEIVRVFAKLHKEYPFELICIGDYKRRDYMTCFAKDDDIEIKKIIEENSSWLTFYPSLPNERVLELMKTCDVGLLPTRADTYGYSVLEMQSCGLPCITTDVRALPEINNDKCGWLISVPKEESGEAKHTTQLELEQLSNAIEKGLEMVLRKIFELDRITLKMMGGGAIIRIKEQHDPVMYGKKLLDVYQKALG